MDKRVLILLLAIIVIISFAIGLQYFTGSNCIPPEISFEHKTYYVDDPVTFASPALEDFPVTWNYGDSTSIETGDTVMHVFRTPGKYRITAMRDEKNNDEDFIEILGRPVVATVSLKKITPVISKSQNIIYENKSVTFKENSTGIKKWKWQVNETGEIKNDQFFRTSFSKSGDYNIGLKVEGDSVEGEANIKITVLKQPVAEPKPAKPKPEPKQEPKPNPKPAKPAIVKQDPWEGRMRDADFMEKFKEAGNLLGDNDNAGDMASDDWANIISKEMLDYYNTEIMVNFEGGKMSPTKVRMEQFKNKLQNGEWLITSVQQPIRTDDHKLITKLNVKIKVIKE